MMDAPTTTRAAGAADGREPGSTHPYEAGVPDGLAAPTDGPASPETTNEPRISGAAPATTGPAPATT
ncbi:hypothetical protein R6L23_14650, partial [Streptomyces sp. SR27]|nr:hypothetical protein [Streptomyces sp. SR27]